MADSGPTDINEASAGNDIDQIVLAPRSVIQLGENILW